MSRKKDAAFEVAHYYERRGMTEHLRAAMAKNGLGESRLSSKDLATLDQFHSRGLAATVELARELSINETTRVIDIGSGLGGPSRYLAERYGCNVHGIDLSPSFVEAASFLAKQSGVADKVTYQQGNALALPFNANAFDLAWTQHVAMNIADRAALYRETFRVLRAGGRFAIYDVVAASSESLHFPVPWASSPETSFLMTADGMRAALSQQGFHIASWIDTTELGITWFLERECEGTKSSMKAALELQAIMGPEFTIAAGNLRRNLSEGRAALIQAVCEKP